MNDEQLESWKEIARHLKRDVRTVQRWEVEERLPVRRHHHRKQATVYAYVAELDSWLLARAPRPRRSWRRAAIFFAGAVPLAALLWIFSPNSQPEKTMLAVLPLQNLSDHPADDHFSDGLTSEPILTCDRVGEQPDECDKLHDENLLP